MAMTMHCDIVSAEESIFSGTVTGVFATGEMGELGIMPRHAQLITRLKPGYVRVTRQHDEDEFYYVSGGLLEVQPHVVTVLADTLIRGEDIQEEAARKAIEDAERALADASPEMDPAEALLQKAQAEAQIEAVNRLRRGLKR